VVADAPRDLEKIITRCLRKDPARRFQHTDDLKIALSELKEESDSGTAVSAQTSTRPGRWKARYVWISAAFAAIVLAALGVWFWSPAQTSHPVPKVVPLTSYPGNELSPSFSPDGNQVAFAWSSASENTPAQGRFHVYLKMIGASEPVLLTHDPADEYSSCGQIIQTSRLSFMMDVPHARQQMGSAVSVRHRAGQSETPAPE
jgi:eukaryotic-like serine/threonine-protein kinase